MSDDDLFGKTSVIERVRVQRWCHGLGGLGVFDKAVRLRIDLANKHGLVEDSKTVAPHFENSVGLGK